MRHWTRASENKETADPHYPENLSVVKPLMWPWFSRVHDRALNRRLLVRSLSKIVEEMQDPVHAITTIPIVADLMGELPVDRWIYYCVDDFGKWPGLDQQALEAMERTVIERADVLIAAGTELKKRLQRYRKNVSLLTHGVDLKHFRSEPAREFSTEGLERPLVVFWGLIDQRMDLDVVRRIDGGLSSGTLLFVGPQDAPDPALAELEHVQCVPPVPYAMLPAVGRAADVLVMPYADLPVTRAMQPLKLLEYLATGRPVVARALPATEPWADCLDLATTPDEFAAAVLRRIREGISDEQLQARGRLEAESWSAKARQFEELIDGDGTAGIP
jgi:glycosyltransferase involved in cell wall biosynthesis